MAAASLSASLSLGKNSGPLKQEFVATLPRHANPHGNGACPTASTLQAAAENGKAAAARPAACLASSAAASRSGVEQDRTEARPVTSWARAPRPARAKAPERTRTNGGVRVRRRAGSVGERSSHGDGPGIFCARTVARNLPKDSRERDGRVPRARSIRPCCWRSIRNQRGALRITPASGALRDVRQLWPKPVSRAADCAAKSSGRRLRKISRLASFQRSAGS